MPNIDTLDALGDEMTLILNTILHDTPKILPKVCLRYAKVCPRYAVVMPTTYLRYAGTCRKYAQDMPKLCLRFAIDMPEIIVAKGVKISTDQFPPPKKLAPKKRLFFACFRVFSPVLARVFACFLRAFPKN